MTDQLIAWAIAVAVLAALSVSLMFILPWWAVVLYVAFGLGWFMAILGGPDW